MVYIPVQVQVCIRMFVLWYVHIDIPVPVRLKSYLSSMVTLWYSTAMVVCSYDQVPTATVSSQFLAVTVKLATRQAVMPQLSRQPNVWSQHQSERLAVKRKSLLYILYL